MALGADIFKTSKEKKELPELLDEKHDIRKAIDNGKLKIYCRPQVNLQNGDILVAQAMLLWESDVGALSPDESIPLAQTDDIVYLENQIFREVCQSYRKWYDSVLPAIKVSVNFFSALYFRPGFAKSILSIIDGYKLDYSFLIIELTENILQSIAQDAFSDLQTLQDNGIQIALNGLGERLPSLICSSSLKFDRLMLDFSCVKNFHLDETGTVNTRAVIDLAQESGIVVSAIGIETMEQPGYLRKLGCYIGQGTLYTKPIPIQEFDKLLAKIKCWPVRNEDKVWPEEARRKYYRIQFKKLLEADMTILQIKGKAAIIGYAKVLIRDIGAGGTCFVSNVKLPFREDIVLQFVTQLLGNDIVVYGHHVWTKKAEHDLFEYSVEFTIDENEKKVLTKLLNQVQVKMRNDAKFYDGRFVSTTPAQYFDQANKN